MTETTPGTASRLAAARVLDAVLHRGRSLKGEFGTELPQIADPRDRALVEAICFAALRNRARYAAALTAWVPKPLGRGDEPLRALLYVGFAQLDALKLPAHAAVDATVEAVRSLGRAHQAGMVMRCCAGRSARGFRRPIPRRSGRTGCWRKSAATGRSTPTRSSPPAPRPRRCGCG